MSESENKQRIQAVFSELARGNGQPFYELLADDGEYIVKGSNSWAKTYVGKRSVSEELFGPLRQLLMRRPTTIAERFIADGDYVVVEARGDNLTKHGVPYQNEYCFVIRMREGRIQTFTEYADTELVTRVLGPREVGNLLPNEVGDRKS